MSDFEARYRERAGAAVEGAGEIRGVLLDREPAPGRDGPLLAGWWREPGDDAIVLPNPWDERAAIALYDGRCWDATRALASQLARALNEIHGRSMSERYWWWLCAPWLLHLVSGIADKALYVDTAYALAPEAVFAGAPLPEPPATMLDGLDAVVTDAGARSLMAALAERLGARVEHRRPAVEAAPPARPAGLRHRVGALALASPRARARALGAIGAQALFGGASGRRALVISDSQLRPRDVARLRRAVPGLRYGTGPSIRGGAPDLGSVPPDQRARDRLKELSGDDPIAAAVVDLLPALTPRTLVEDWPRVAAESRSRLGDPCSVVVGNYWARELENEFVARCAEAGRGVAFVQHGGTYCQASSNPQERLETSEGATFLAWGRCDGARTAPSPYLASLRDRHRGGDRTVLVEWLVPTYPHRFSSTPLGNQVHANARLLGDLVDALPAGQVRDSLFLKRYPGAVAYVPRAPILEALPHPRRLQSPFAVDWLRTAKIAVITYPDTTLIEAMVLGVPLIGLWRPDLWDMRPGAAEHFERLGRLGVVFGDAQAAAERLVEVHGCAREWWAGDEIRSARRAFLERFAAGGDWAREWTTALQELGA